MLKKRNLFIGALILSVLPSIAITGINRNSLRHGPRIASEFEKGSKELSAQHGNEEKDSRSLKLQERKATGDSEIMAVADIDLSNIVATVYDHATGSIGLYRLPETVGGEFVPVTTDVSSYFGGDIKGNLFYACHDGRWEIYNETNEAHGHKIQAYDVATWTPVGDEIAPKYYRASDLAINPSDGLGYAYCDVGGLTFRLFSIDLSTGAQTDINPSTSFLANFPVTACFGKDGNLYSVTAFGYFGRVDLSTGKVETISEINWPKNVKSNSTDDNWSMMLDPDTGNFILAMNFSTDYGKTFDTEIYTINPESGESQKVAQYKGKGVTSLFVMPHIAAAGAPSAVKEITADFPGGALSGTVNFTMPATLNDGSAGQGELDWTLYEGNNVYDRGKATYGASVSVPVTVSESGRYYFSVSVSNSIGESDRTRQECWIGPDIPATPKNVTVNYNEANSTFLVKWDPVTSGANNAFVDAAAISYDVKRMPEGKLVAENIKTTEYTDTYQVKGIENIYYEVVAKQDNRLSAPGKSGVINVGYMVLPYNLGDEDLTEGLPDWTILDSNNDGSTWDIGRYNGVTYIYSEVNNADDWLITPPIKALAGCKYTLNLTFDAQMAKYPESVEVWMGDAPDATHLNKNLLPKTEISKESQEGGQSYTLDIKPETDGKFHIGIHVVSVANAYRLNVTEFKISAPLNESAPMAPQLKSIAADKTGALKLTGSIVAPTMAENGKAVTEISKIEVRRGLSVIATLENVTPGATVEFTDNSLPEKGVYSYRAYAYTGEAMSLPSETLETFVGVNVPGLAGNVKILRSLEDNGSVTVTWDRPEFDVDGYPLNGDVDYLVSIYYDNEYVNPALYFEDVMEPKVTFTPNFGDEKNSGFVLARIYSGNSEGAGWYAKSQNIYVGEALPLPFKESFPNYTLENPWGDGLSNGPQIGSISDDILSTAIGQYNGWNRMTDASFDTTEGSQDHDNGFAGMFGWSYVEEKEEGGYHNEYTDLVSPVIKISGSKPMLTFYTFNWTNRGISDPNILDVDAVTPDGVRHNVLHQVIGELGNVQDWLFVKADLSPFVGQEIYLIFRGTIISGGDTGYNWVLIDNIKVDELEGVDLAVSNIEAPVIAEPDQEFKVSARVSNIGNDATESYLARLICNDAEIASKTLGRIESGAFETVEFAHSLNVSSPVGNRYRIIVESQGDNHPENNTTEEVTVARNLNLLPEPEVVVYDTQSHQLSWREPNIDKATPAMVLDDFESYPCIEGDIENDWENSWVTFLTEAGDWIFVDRDQYPIGGMMKYGDAGYEYIEFPGIEVHSAQSWWVQNRLYMDFNDTYYGHDNSWQYLANMYVVNEEHTAAMPQDDWAISPELCGREQLVTLWARSYDPNIPESVEFLYSTGSVNPDDFHLIRRIERLSGAWTQYAFVVPQGAGRFAIRGCSYVNLGSAQTFVDDVTFYPAKGDKQNPEFLGYNVYEDNKLKNASPLKELSIGDVDPAAHKYAVSAVYAEGESRAVEASDIAGVEEIIAGNVVVNVSNGVIRISGLNGLGYSVVAPTGIVRAAGCGEMVVEIPVSQGIWIVKYGKKVVKVVVK